ncbi:MAG TPA: chromate efflux transporter, partial [Candidatus Binataceae bacterium]
MVSNQVPDALVAATEIHSAPSSVLHDIALSFLRLGTTAFGGPAAHIAMMEAEFVVRRQWLSHEEFLDMLGATNLIPGPNSTEMAIHIGHQRAGWKGLVTAGACFILPAVVLTVAVAWAYVRFGSLPQVQGILYGIKPVIIAIVIQALWRLGRTAVKTGFLAALALVASAAGFVGANEIAILLGAGVVAALVFLIRNGLLSEAFAAATASIARPVSASGAAIALAIGAAPFSLTTLFLFFLKVGAILFGSGYVLLAFLQADLVDRLHWMTKGQLLDAVAVGQFTPGPVFSTATFIGYVLGGV